MKAVQIITMIGVVLNFVATTNLRNDFEAKWAKERATYTAQDITWDKLNAVCKKLGMERSSTGCG